MHVKIVGSMRVTLGLKWLEGRIVNDFSSVNKLIDYLYLRKTGSERSIMFYCWLLTNFTLWAASSEWVTSQFPSKNHLTPDDFLSWTKQELEVLVQRYADETRNRSLKRGPSSMYANCALAGLKTYFRVNGFRPENNLELLLQSYHQPPRTRNTRQYVPTIGEACIMAERTGNVRNRPLILTMSSSGLRNTAVRAVLVGDVIKEIEAGHENLLIKVEPEWNRRLPGACKGSIPYYTFTSAEATRAIKEMLDRRREEFGEVKEDEPLFTSRGYLTSYKVPVSQRELEEIVKIAAREACLKDWKNVTPHCLRKVFEGVLRAPLKDGSRMDTKDQEFLMGHILPGSQEAYYDWSKINRLREQFAKLVFEDNVTPEQENVNAYKRLAKILEIDVDKIRADRERVLGRRLLATEELEVLERAIKVKISPKQDRTEQRIVQKNELQTYLSVGWKFRGVVDENSVIVEKFSDDDSANPSI
jgi:integrase